jgi:histidinol phosphatase-like enzyme
MIARPNRPRRTLSIVDRRTRGLFLDRWGTLLVTPQRGFAEHPDELVFFDGALDALFRAQQAGFGLYLLGNEDAVAQGKLSDEAWKEVQGALHRRLAAHGLDLKRDYSCVDHPQGRGSHQQDSVYLLPNTGAFHHSVHFDNLALEHSWVIGDSTVELAAGWRAGTHIAAVKTGVGLADRTFEVDPPVVGRDLTGVLSELVRAATTLRWS